MVNGHSGSTPWYARGFPTGGASGDKLSEHYNKHGKKMGFSSKSDYNNAAVDFMNKTPTANIDYFVDSRGTVYKYDHDTVTIIRILTNEEKYMNVIFGDK